MTIRVYQIHRIVFTRSLNFSRVIIVTPNFKYRGNAYGNLEVQSPVQTNIHYYIILVGRIIIIQNIAPAHCPQELLHH